MIYLLFIIYVILSTSGMLLIKLGGYGTAFSFSNKILSINVNFILLLGLVFYIVSFLLFVVMLQKSDLSYIYPVSAGVINVVTICIGITVLKENINIYGIVGVVCIVIGIVLTNIKT